LAAARQARTLTAAALVPGPPGDANCSQQNGSTGRRDRQDFAHFTPKAHFQFSPPVKINDGVSPPKLK